MVKATVGATVGAMVGNAVKDVAGSTRNMIGIETVVGIVMGTMVAAWIKT